MGKLNKISLKELIDNVGLIIRDNDIRHICYNEKLIKEYLNISNDLDDERRTAKLSDFLIEHEDEIDKEKLVLLTIMNLRSSIKIIENEYDNLKEQNKKHNISNFFDQASNFKIQINAFNLMLEKCIELSRNTKAFLTFYYYDELQKRYRLQVMSSKDVIEGKKKNKENSRNSLRFKEVDNYFKSESNNEVGLEYVLQSILLTDLYEIFPDVRFGDGIRTMILDNELLRNNVKTIQEIRELKTDRRIEEYAELVDNIDFPNTLPVVKQTLMEYSDYIDIDKLLLISGYRFYDSVENDIVDKKNIEDLKTILDGIIKNISKQTTEISCKLQKKDYETNNYENCQVDFSKRDLRNCISRFISDSYITKTQIKEYKEKIINNEMTLAQMDSQVVKLIFDAKNIDELSELNEENLVYAAVNNNWNARRTLDLINENENFSKESILKLIKCDIIGSNDLIDFYMQGKFSKSVLLDLKEELDLENYIDLNSLIGYYKNSISKDSNDINKKHFEYYFDLYKNIVIDDKEDDVKEKESNKLIQEIIEHIDEENYTKTIYFYYNGGMLNLETIADWNDDKFIETMYDKNIITIDDLKRLAKTHKISYELLSNKYSDLILNNEMEYNERLNIIRSGFIHENCILDLYMKNLIFEADLKSLVNDGCIREASVNRAIKNRTIEQLEANSAIKLKGLNNLTKIHNDIYSENNESNDIIENVKKAKLIIDPNEREKFIKLFGAYNAQTDLEEESPFYNYEFYVIPDNNGEIGLESIVIAERYYEDKETEMKFSTNNATYFFKYKDLMVLSNLEKSEMIKERKGIVFTAKHVVATETTQGRWGTEVVRGVANAMMSSDLKEYSKDNQTKIILEKLSQVYSDEELSKIVDKAIEIDFGEHVYEIQENDVVATKKEKKLNSSNGEER